MKSTKPSDILDKLSHVDSISDFHEIVSRCSLVSSDPRFMTVVMDISNKCNLRCRMCYFSFDRYFKAKPVYLRPETFRKISGKLLPYARTLTLSCGSEPLTSPFFIEILKEAAKYRVPFVDFATSGTLLTEKYADALIEHGVTDVMFSVDAATKETYEYIRRGASFDRLLRNIKYLSDQKKLLRSSIPRLRFNMTLMKLNIHEIEDLVVLAADLGVTQLDFRHLVVYKGLGTEQESLVHYKDLSDYWLDRARQKAEELGLEIVMCPENFKKNGQEGTSKRQESKAARLREIFSKVVKNPKHALRIGTFRLLNLLRGEKGRLTPYCSLPFHYVLINAGGHILPCPNCHGEAAYGTLTDDVTFNQIWFGQSYQELRGKILNNDPPEMCKICPALGLSRPDEEEFFQPREV